MGQVSCQALMIKNEHWSVPAVKEATIWWGVAEGTGANDETNRNKIK